MTADPPRPAPPRISQAERAFRHSNPAALQRRQVENTIRERERNAEAAARAAEERVRALAARSPVCRICKLPCILSQGDTHYSCSGRAGQVCTCPQDCSRGSYGDGPVDCARDCVPCRQRRGEPLSGRKGKR
jgi:hypothetical protein